MSPPPYLRYVRHRHRQRHSVDTTPRAPTITSIPAISGNVWVGATLTASSGVWDAYPVPTYTYQWRRVDTSANISGATSSTYTPVSGDIGHTLTCVVTPSNGLGSPTPSSAATTAAVIATPVAPVNTVAPSISGSANVGATLTASSTWTGTPTPTITYAWKKDGVANGSTGTTYVPVTGDIGSVITVTATGTNVGGTASATSAATSAVTSSPTAKLFVFWGQSNMGANGGTGTPTGFTGALSKVIIWNPNTSALEPYDFTTNSSESGGAGGWGPEAEFLLNYTTANPSETIYVVKWAVPGTPLAVSAGNDWNPASTGELLDTLTAHVLAAQTAITGLGKTPQVVCVCSMQGEADVATTYQADLAAFFAAVRSRWTNAASAKMVVGQIYYTPPISGVAAAQLAAVEADGNAEIISNSDLTRTDGVHYNKAGVEAMGLRMYQAYLGTYQRNPVSISITWSAGYTGGSIPKNTTVGTAIGTLSGVNGTGIVGSLTYSEYADPDGVITVSGSNVLLAADLSAQSTGATHSFTVNAVNELDGSFNQAFSLSVAAAVVGTGGDVVLSPYEIRTGVLSNGGLTLSTGKARAQAKASTGKFFFSAQVGADGAGGVGVCNATFDVTTSTDLYNSANSAASWANGVTYNTPGNTAGGTVWAAGSIIDIAVDVGARLLWARVDNGTWNGSGTDNPATGVGGLDISSITGDLYPIIECSDPMTVNFGQTSYSYAPPSGFSNWVNYILAMTGPQFHPEYALTAATLSNGGLTVASAGGTLELTTKVASTGKKYCEMHVDTTSTYYSVGLIAADLSHDSLGFIGGDAGFKAVGWDSRGDAYINGSSVKTLPTWGASGDVISIAVDLTAHKLWFRKGSGNWNNDVSADPAAGTGSIDISGISAALSPAVGFYNTGQFTANFGATSYAQSAPSGFGNW